MSQHFAVESGKQTVGVALRVPGGFRFFYSDPQFRSLDGKIFPRAKMLARRVAELAAKFRNRKNDGAPDTLVFR